jgi:ribosome-binding protein aMBF1 (putative translation factor)
LNDADREDDMEAELEMIREAVAKRTRRTAALSAELRDAVTTYVRREREKGATFEALAASIGLSMNTLARAARNGGAGPALVPVRMKIEEAGRRGPMVVTPSGYRVEGLSVSQAAELLRMVG